MKVISTPIKEEKVYRVTCEKCYAELEYDNTDFAYGVNGGSYVECPICHTKVYVDGADDIRLDENNIEFPQHFYQYGISEDSVDIKDDRIQEWIRNLLKKAKVNNYSPGEYTYIGSGNTYIILQVFEDEYNIIVAKNYYECSISR